MYKVTTLTETVWIPDGLPKALVDRAVQKIKSRTLLVSPKININEYLRCIYVSTETYGDSFWKEELLKNFVGDLAKELRKTNEQYTFLKEVYNLEPKSKPWWKRLWN